MSLRSFHIVFITVCTLLCVFLTLWAFVLAPESSGMVTASGIVGIVGILLIPLYALFFLKKVSKLPL
jgi:hypothetical protein